MKIHDGKKHFCLSKKPDFFYEISKFKKVDPPGENSIKVRSLDDLEAKMDEYEDEKGLTFYLRLPERAKDMDPKYLDELDALVNKAESKQSGWIIIFGGQPTSCLKLNGLHCFKKQAPWKLRLKTLEHSILAEICLQEIKHRGYMLTVGGDINADHRAKKKMMMQIVREKLTKEQIEQRNVYLAKDCVDRAISSLNLRVKEQLDLELENMDKGVVDEDLKKAPLPFVLHLQDFEVAKVSKSDMEKKQKEVDAKISQMLGWGAAEDENSPMRWFETQRQILRRQQQVEEEEQEGISLAAMTAGPGGSGVGTANDQQQWDFNVIVEGGEGVGKTEFVTIAAEFLHAYGKLKNPSLRVDSADMLIPDAYGTLDDAQSKAVSVFDAARNEKDAPLLIKQAELLCPGASPGQDLKPQMISQFRSIAQVIISETHDAPFVALSCSSGTYRSVVTVHNDMQGRFPHHVILQDPTIQEVMEACKRLCAPDRKNVAWSPDLEDKLLDHLEENHATGKGLVIGGFSKAKKLVEEALRKRKERLSKVAARGAAGGDGGGESKRPSLRMSTSDRKSLGSRRLLPIGFDIGKEIGDPEMREEVYKEMEGLIGMEDAKKWLRLVQSSIDLANISGKKSGLKRCYNLVLTGKPGTGKTTFARLVHKFLKAHGVLTGEFVEKNALELKGEYVGSTTPLVKQCFQEAKGGTLFLDEAYGLSSDNFKGGGDSFSKEAVRTLLTEVENNRTGTVVILAGYEDKMKHLMRAGRFR